MSAVMTLFFAKSADLPVAAFDADLNIHIPNLLGLEEIPTSHHLSNEGVSTKIKKWLIGENPIEQIGAFRKTTPPTSKSNIIRLSNIFETPLAAYSKKRDNIAVFAVGTYQNEDIGASCYHNNLSVLENILSHTDDSDGFLVADMVAGVDAFAGTLHAQFDTTIFVVEPTKRSVEVCKKYLELAKEAEVFDQLFVVGNKIRGDKDVEFISSNLPTEKILGYFHDDEHIRAVDQEIEGLDISLLQDGNIELLERINSKVKTSPISSQKRLEKLWELHRKYVSQAFVKDRFGDLTGQIDESFSFNDE